ncbi:hypothetical protein ABVK25_012458 [Lepraria finkii]|uniref:Geranylgeranyl pyrophosphate synthetase n=1 Tax=Lepraria finkii TaxID=1340010 RepID=A0ABR4AE52_9LECA
MASTILAEISRPDLLDLSTPPLASITDVKHLSSYNWIEAPTPTIAVPGSPSLWSAPRAPRQLKKDSGLIYIAQNAARHPESPLESLFRALYIANPSFDIRSIDIVTDRNNIRKLLSFINPDSTRNGLETFTINIEFAKNTAIFAREETATHEFIGLHEFRGFGHEFEKAYTTSQISGSTGHHRIISYRFSDLNFIVRHETDGYVDAGTRIPSSNSKEPESDSLSSMLESLSLSPTSSPPTGSKLTIREEGRVIPLESTLEIKTRVSHKPLEIQEVAPQLWVSQTFKLVRAYHHKGIFQRPEVEDVATLIKRWEKRNQTDLRKLAALITKILNVVKGYGGNATVKYDAKDDKLVVWKVDGKKMLPKDLYSKWDDRDNSEVETNAAHNAGAESTVKPVDGVETKAEGKSIAFSPGDTKGKKAAEPAKEGEQTLPDDLFPNPTPAKDTDSDSQDKGGEHLAADSGETLLSSSSTR